MVNGSIGAGVSVFISMAVVLTCGMGYPVHALLFTGKISAGILLLEHMRFGERGSDRGRRQIGIAIPEDLNYRNAFADILEEYTSGHELIQVKATNLGSLFRLFYTVDLKNPGEEKEFFDALRVRNGNLEISSSLLLGNSGEL